MAYSAMVRRLLISSPSDIPTTDIAAVFQAVNRWNATYGRQFAAAVVPLHWSEHAAARHGAHPQDVLNRQLVAESDAVVALFFCRLGTPTPNAVSGTADEIQAMQNEGGYVAILRRASEMPADVDEGQLGALTDFLDSLQQSSLILSYSDENGLQRHVDQILAQLVTRDQAANLTASESADAERAGKSLGVWSSSVEAISPTQERMPPPDVVQATRGVQPDALSIWPRIEVVPRKGLRGGTTRDWYLVLVNNNDAPAHQVTVRLEPEHADDRVPAVVDAEHPIEVLAPHGQVRYLVAVTFGSASQVRCVVEWTAEGEDHRNITTLRFI